VKSCRGKAFKKDCKTVNPPKPESNTPIMETS
jgi:hypothetical protein